MSERQPPVYFGLGGGTIKGVSRPGEIVWSRVFLMDGALHVDLGRGTVVELPAAETERRWQATTPAVADHARRPPRRDPRPDDGPPRPTTSRSRTRDDAARADAALAAKAAMFDAMGIAVHLCGAVVG